MGALMSRLRTAAAAGLVGLLGAFGPVQPQSADEPTLYLVSFDGRHNYTQMQFAVEGSSVQGLYPGAVKEIKLKISNPYSFALRIHTLSGKVIATSRRGCAVSKANLRVKEYIGRLPVTVPARSRTVLTGALPITMPREATANCADTRFTILLYGTGMKASR
jgi:hypothetical protein